MPNQYTYLTINIKRLSCAVDSPNKFLSTKPLIGANIKHSTTIGLKSI